MNPGGRSEPAGLPVGSPPPPAGSRLPAADEVSDARAQLRALDGRADLWRIQRWRRLHPQTQARLAAVLVLFGVLDSRPAAAARSPVPDDLDVLLQRRSPSMGHHPGQVSFPGGGIDPGDDGPVGAALREAAEETGLDPAGVEVLAALDAVPLPVSNNLVTPVLGWWARPSQVAAVDHAETVDVFRVPVADLLDPANRGVVRHRVGAQEVATPAFDVAGVVVWGFTAMVLDDLFDALGWTVPWQPVRDLRP